jgi:hypothetical protein
MGKGGLNQISVLIGGKAQQLNVLANAVAVV